MMISQYNILLLQKKNYIGIFTENMIWHSLSDSDKHPKKS